MGNWYNGYCSLERDKKFREYKRLVRRGELSPPSGPCALCNDPGVPVEPHDEDYSEPYVWAPPALLGLCRHCHRSKLHRRFSDVCGWQAFLAHVRRGGYARDLKDKAIREEVNQCKLAIRAGEPFTLRTLRPYPGVPEEEWFANMRLDLQSLTDPGARPRP